MTQILAGRVALPLAVIRRGWSYLRAVFGDDAYDKYLAHWNEAHAATADNNDAAGCAAPDSQSAPLDRKTFFRMRQEEQWNGIRRCC